MFWVGTCSKIIVRDKGFIKVLNVYGFKYFMDEILKIGFSSKHDLRALFESKTFSAYRSNQNQTFNVLLQIYH